jgi:hypothetical protein
MTSLNDTEAERVLVECVWEGRLGFDFGELVDEAAKVE